MTASGRKILVVEDHPWIPKVLEFVATDAGHTAVVCKDGVDALDKFAELMPDLMLDKLLRLRQQPSQPPAAAPAKEEPRGPDVRNFPGTRNKGDW